MLRWATCTFAFIAKIQNWDSESARVQKISKSEHVKCKKNAYFSAASTHFCFFAIASSPCNQTRISATVRFLWRGEELIGTPYFVEDALKIFLKQYVKLINIYPGTFWCLFLCWVVITWSYIVITRSFNYEIF